MKTKKFFRIKTVKASPGLFTFLEKKKLIRRIKPSNKILNTRSRSGAVDKMYSSDIKYGSHKLIGIGKRSTEIALSFHGDNEDFLLLNPGRLKLKPLYLVLGLEKQKAFELKAKNGGLKAADLIAVKAEFNDPGVSFFTMLRGTVHCELTVPGKGIHPVFFVSEPSRMKSIKQRTYGYKFELGRS